MSSMVSMSTTSAEEKSPLLSPPENLEEKYNMPEETASEGPSKDHKRAVYQGVAFVVKRWPDHISSGWMPVIYLAFFSIALSLGLISMILIIGNIRLAVDLRFRFGRYNLHNNDTLLDIEISCEGKALSTTTFPDMSRSSSLKLSEHTQFLLLNGKLDSPFDDNNESLKRVFFITTEEGITLESLCSVESAAKSLSNTTIYFFVLHDDKPKRSNFSRFIEHLQTMYRNLSVNRIKIKSFFSGSFFSEMLENNNSSKFLSPSMIEFAARILTLWRHGGISVDPGMAVKNESLFPGRGSATMDEVILSETGSVISVGYQCHQLLFQMMSAFTELVSKPEKFDTSSENVVSLAVGKFCTNETLSNNHTDVDYETLVFDTCPGVSVLRSNLICQHDDNRDTCLWKHVSEMLPQERESLCPLAFGQEQ